ncbi:hypothetical protein S7335_5068 [Synechococcus sp. PCC 7335]|uniref:hypothetical protein n=1 Tax=Synechococcus sp. (strain ATCC 29403 / PCC 7335) TaxID=91464 RepID=UPI00017EBFEA|nr:hypothetical protein [Synechococcus sp. PCC 7335]EDX87359.1 hypothetical protein S7335_5068 [Synechococcus sp. PCC 7335]
MFSRFRRAIGRFFNRSRRINHKPINRFSLIIIILVDLFILFNVFAGLDDISRWPLSPEKTYPCRSEWISYREDTAEEKDYRFINQLVSSDSDTQNPRLPATINQSYYRGSYYGSYQDLGRGHLGEVSEICLQYESALEAVDSLDNKTIISRINDIQAEISSFTRQNADIRQQYDSTLLEEIAGQPREQSINAVEAAQARREIEQNDQAIAQREATLETLKTELISTPESQTFLSLLSDDTRFNQIDNGYQRASFWYPSIQLFFQGLFLLPLIVVASGVNRLAERRDYGYISLISWHLFVIFCIPLVWKIFEFLQFGFLIELLIEFLEFLFGGLRFLINYLQILLIPAIGFGVIKFFQRFVFNTRLQAANRVQSGRCVNCAKKIRKRDLHCPHCSYSQYQECTNCHNLTYRHLPHCKHCGTEQTLEL